MGSYIEVQPKMAEPEKPREIKFHYIKSNFFRTIHSEGVIGGVTPFSSIVINFYSERQSIPQIVTHELREDLTLGKEIERSGREGVIREVEVSVSMNLLAAKALKDWLDLRLKEAEEAAVFQFDFQKVDRTVHGDGQNVTVYDVVTVHCPEVDNYGHCEVRIHRGGVALKENKINRTAKNKFKLSMSKALHLVRKPTDIPMA